MLQTLIERLRGTRCRPEAWPAPCAALAYASALDCARWGLSRAQWTPWNWASRWVLEQARPAEAERLLDVGCVNNPHATEHILREGVRATNIDIQPRAADLPGPIAYVQHDLNEPLPFADRSFDCLISVSTLEHLRPAGRLACLRECWRMLRPGGRLALTLGCPLGIARDPAAVGAIATHPFFADRWCAVHFPIDLAAMLGAIGLAPPWCARLFPGFAGFDEGPLLHDPSLLFDAYNDHPGVPDIGDLRRARAIEVGLFAIKPLPDGRTGT